MTRSAVVPAKVQTLNEALATQPFCEMHIYSRRQIIYRPGEAARHVFFILHGQVKVSCPAKTTKHAAIDIYTPGQFFGESALLGGLRSEEATVLKNIKVLVCPVREFIDFVGTHSGHGLALLQEMTRRSLQIVARFEDVSFGNTKRRLARVLLHLAERLGARGADGQSRLPPLQHEVLSEFVGTSRAIISGHMNEFRRTGQIHFSRLEIVFEEDELRQWLESTKLPSLGTPVSLNEAH